MTHVLHLQLSCYLTIPILSRNHLNVQGILPIILVRLITMSPEISKRDV